MDYQFHLYNLFKSLVFIDRFVDRFSVAYKQSVHRILLADDVWSGPQVNLISCVDFVPFCCSLGLGGFFFPAVMGRPTVQVCIFSRRHRSIHTRVCLLCFD